MSTNGHKKHGKDLVRQAVEDAGSDRVPDILDSLPLVTEPRCNVCKSEFRPLIDRMIAGPYSYMAIARQFKGKDKHLNGNIEAVRKSIERHAKSHVTVRDAAVREIIEQRALEAGLLVEDQKNQLLTTEALLDLYVQKGFDQVTEPGSRVRHQDILEAVKTIEQMRRDTVSEQLEVWKKQVWAISQAVRMIVPEELHPDIILKAEELMKSETIEITPEAQRVRELEVVRGS